ncbi:glutaminase A [Brevibacterium ihuae]|uniref:glutaminase A n=1 Tax=Brevibacterium ihuae TaxID=1631743 RepID=UPI000C78F403|nr:glutaminase A [Brevibacterium ihuae]
MYAPIQRYLDTVHESLLDIRGGSTKSSNTVLASQDPNLCGLAMTTSDGFTYTAGDAEVPFAIQSISKVFCYAIALQDRGFAYMDSKIDVEPSGSSFADLSSESGSGRPKNALINIGAIAATGQILPERGRTVFDKILSVMSACAGRQLIMDEDVHSQDSQGSAHNRGLTWFLSSWGILEGDPNPAHDDYTKQCAIAVTAKDLSVMAATLANLGVNPVTQERVFDTRVVQRVLSVMLTCGMYDDSGDWVASVGLPAKSGVGGGIISVLPGQLGLASFSPPLDEHGSSVRGLAAHRQISSDLELHFVRTSKAGLSTIRSNETIDKTPSTTRRPEAAEKVLAEHGHQAHVVEVMGDLLFSGAEVLSRAVAVFGDDTECIVIDLSRADDIAEVSVGQLSRMARALDESGIALGLVDPDDRLAELMVPVEMDVEIFGSRNEALTWAENRILEEYGDADCFPDEEADRPTLIGSIDPEFREKIAEHLVDEEYAAGDVIRRIGQKFDGIRFITSGTVHTLSPADRGREVVSILTAGMSFGELSLNDHFKQPFTVKAETDTEIKLLPKDAIEKMMETDPITVSHLWRAIAVEGYARLGQVLRGHS